MAIGRGAGFACLPFQEIYRPGQVVIPVEEIGLPGAAEILIELCDARNLGAFEIQHYRLCREFADELVQQEAVGLYFSSRLWRGGLEQVEPVLVAEQEGGCQEAVVRAGCGS